MDDNDEDGDEDEAEEEDEEEAELVKSATAVEGGAAPGTDEDVDELSAAMGAVHV